MALAVEANADGRLDRTLIAMLALLALAAFETSSRCHRRRAS